MADVDLRQVTLGELSELADLVRSYYHYDGLNFSPPVVEALCELVEDERLGHAWFILSEGTVAGYAIVTVGFDHEFGGRISLLTDFFLLPEYRGKGLGKAALRQIEAFARSQGYRSIELFTIPENERARRLYRSAGFRDQERIPMTKLLQ